MGKYDSTKTRVTPIFDALDEQDSTGRRWLSQLLRLPIGGTTLSGTTELGPILRSGWGTEEVSLRAPRALLTHLISNLPAKPPANLGTENDATRAKRRALLDHDPEAVREATNLLSRGDVPRRGWCVFEGSSRPDVYLETDSLIVVIEGKRTEAGPERGTEWMPVRDQLLRHLDCARESCGGSKRVVGFYIVEATNPGDPKSMEVPAAWVRAAEEIQSQQTIDGSLPHRTVTERAEIAAGFLGVTTWQRVCAELGVDFPIDDGPVAAIDDPYRFALVELFAPQLAADDVGEGIAIALRRHPERREAQVRVVVESLVLDDVDLIVLPGWSLVGSSPPPWLVERSRGRTIIVEMMSPEPSGGGKSGGGSRSYVLQDGECVLGPVRQLLSSSAEAWKKNQFSPEAHETARAWVDDRRWTLSVGGTAMLALCGEINIVRGGAQTPIALGLENVPLVVNSSHTRMKPQGSREQRAKLSEFGLVLVTANTHESGSASDKASWTTAEIYWRGEPVRFDDAAVSWSADREVRAQRIWLDDRTRAEQGTPVVLGEISRSKLS